MGHHFESGTPQAGRMWNNRDQCAIFISEGYTDHERGADFFSHSKIKEPDFTTDGRHSRLVKKLISGVGYLGIIPGTGMKRHHPS